MTKERTVTLPRSCEPTQWVCSSGDDAPARALAVTLRTLLGSMVRGGADRMDEARADLLVVRPAKAHGAPREEQFVVWPAVAARTLVGALAQGACATVLRFVAVDRAASQLRGDVHKASRLLQGAGEGSSPESREVFARLVGELRRRHLPAEADAVAAAAQVLAEGRIPPPEAENLARAALTALSERIRTPGASTVLAARAPEAYRHILVADDDGYPAECVSYLEACGYRVEVVTDTGEAAQIITADPADVLLCDMTWGLDPGAGQRLMELAAAESAFKLIVAMSGAPVTPGEAPHAGAICAGPVAKTEVGARQLHDLVRRWAER